MGFYTPQKEPGLLQNRYPVDITLRNKITKRLLHWYDRHQRDLPWRRTRNPYFIWVSEIMLQQTQVDTVIPFYHRFLSEFPTIETLAKAPLQDVLKVWENLGYYSRARHLHEAAKVIMNGMGGNIPKTEDGLLRIPGIGPYTAAAILSIAFGQKIAAIDGNVRRVICRLFGIRGPINRAKTRKKISEVATALIPREEASRFNQGIMDFGAALCTPRKPACGICPLKELCLALQKGWQTRLPVKGKRKPIPHKLVAVGVIHDHQGRLLIVQRPMEGLLGGLWKFPGGEKQEGDTIERSLREAIKMELGIDVKVLEALTSIKHAYSHFRITLFAFSCSLRKRQPKTLMCNDWQWIEPSRLNNLPFSKADRKIMSSLRLIKGFSLSDL